MTNDNLGHTYTYDAESRIAQMNGGGAVYIYDADGNRVRKDVSGQPSTEYFYLGNQILAELNITSGAWSNYVFFNGLRVARKDFATGAVSYYFSDMLRTAAVITNSSGTILDESDYYPWGGELQITNNLDNHYKFTGKERDAESQLDYFGARYYSNGLGRFITPDWAAKAAAVPYADYADPQSLNLYTYVRNLPTVRFDPDGHTGEGATDPDLDKIKKACREGCAAVKAEPKVTHTMVEHRDPQGNLVSYTDTKTTTQSTYVFDSNGGVVGNIQTVTTQVTSGDVNGQHDSPEKSVTNVIGNTATNPAATRMALQDLGGAQNLAAVQNSIAKQPPGFLLTLANDVWDHPFRTAGHVAAIALMATCFVAEPCGAVEAGISLVIGGAAVGQAFYDDKHEKKR